MTAQPIDPTAQGMWSPARRVAQDPVHVYPYDLVDGRYELVADSAEELIVKKPFDIRPRVRDIAP